ncbi:MAG: TolC family outer membrane protein [Sphingobium sp.]|nr:TolC family outer membrane protein [Sphingobium sp.]MBP9158804.1 TolC family outer membrane protein [Sphingobium sp.]
MTLRCWPALLAISALLPLGADLYAEPAPAPVVGASREQASKAAVPAPIEAGYVPHNLATMSSTTTEEELAHDDDPAMAGSLQPDDDLASALADAYASNPDLAARRYELRASDDDLGLALSQIRPTAQVQISGGYEHVIPGRVTQAARPLVDRLNDPTIDRNDLNGQFVIDQPLSTGGRAKADIEGARAAILAGREALRGVEGDLLVNVIAAYVDVRRNARTVAIRESSLALLGAMLDEVIARRQAGELTRTDIAQAQTQLQSARVQLNAARAELEQSRAQFTALVGREPKSLAPEPRLPLLPQSIDDALETAEQFNPDLAAAIQSEKASRARIAAARAEGHPTLSVRGIAGANGTASPFDTRDQDVSFSARATLNVPLFSGGRVSALKSQALNRNSADRLRVEAARRQMVGSIVTSWNQMVSARRNEEAQRAQLAAARIYYEGSLAEYRSGLRSTFDVLYAQNALRETEIALLSSRRDAYVASASLLRQLGQLEVGKILTGTTLYDSTRYTARAMRRAALPWDGVVREFDRVGSSGTNQQPIEAVGRASDRPQVAPAKPGPLSPDLATTGPITPIPGTTP